MATRMREILWLSALWGFTMACGVTDVQVREAVEKTRQIEALVLTSVAGTQAVPSPPESKPSATPPPPEGFAYVPDVVGLGLADARATCGAAELPFYWIEMINKDVPEYSVYAQTPGPGSLISLQEKDIYKKLRLLVSVYSYTPTPETGGGSGGGACNPATFTAYCVGLTGYWCENHQIRSVVCGAACMPSGNEIMCSP